MNMFYQINFSFIRGLIYAGSTEDISNIQYTFWLTIKGNYFSGQWLLYILPAITITILSMYCIYMFLMILKIN